MTHAMEQLAEERARSQLELVRRLRRARRQRMLRRARRMGCRAEERLIEAWRCAADLRARSGYPAD